MTLIKQIATNHSHPAFLSVLLLAATLMVEVKWVRDPFQVGVGVEMLVASLNENRSLRFRSIFVPSDTEYRPIESLVSHVLPNLDQSVAFCARTLFSIGWQPLHNFLLMIGIVKLVSFCFTYSFTLYSLSHRVRKLPASYSHLLPAAIPIKWVRDPNGSLREPFLYISGPV